MSLGVLESVVIIIPSFSEGYKSDKGVVHRYVTGFVLLVAPDVAQGIHGPGNMPSDDRSEGITPAHGGEASQKEQQYWLGNSDIQIIFLEELVEVVLLQIGNVGGIEEKHLRLRVEQPSHV